MTKQKTFCVWITRQKERTLVTGQFENSFAAKLWLAARTGRKTYDIVAVRVREESEDENEQAGKEAYSGMKL